MKILHTSDWHLGRRPTGGIGEYSKIRYEDYFLAAEYIVDEAIENKVDIFIIAGDLFDRSSLLPDILFKTENILEKLKKSNITTLLIEGNHDKIYSHNDSWISYLENKGLVKVPKFKKNGDDYNFIPIRIDNINFYGIPYHGVLIDDILLVLSKKLDENEKNIVIAHTAIGGNFIPGCTKREIIDLFKDKVLYIAGGHLHSFKIYPEDLPYFFVPGCPEYWDLNEKNNKGYIIFNTENKEYKFYPSKKRKITSYKFKSSENIIEKIKDIEIEYNEIIILKILVDSDGLIEDNEIEQILKDKGVLKVLIQKKYDINEEYNSFEEVDTKSIEYKVVKKWGNIFSKNSVETVNYIEKLKEKITENDNEIFEVFDHFLNKLIKGEIDENK
ncbi:DNA repair exonuclease SbcCD nuclease subunit [Marinitoga hydrogenitolerans DSM 16785]|uniref:DNA repair exonuclease SbcCD nuclease subunit n=1 Tax=Marinitoga hydrogenitolerans (strain DSM 16785 / JCM 12826 / AT1271) TaxID=1122195 RepID=A0A1M4W5S1_MARH1|nr:DNA repair exonuclease [Marinitoga hydrogenitolerans]SHE76624.1 DNA repair exonuclease SbcCD nuclease subunit [Marinitoga hydrogenitolerans DSM 16785]